jgi:hypothetical protein
MATRKTPNSSYAKEFAIAFVISVTEASDDRHNWIAKRGKDSIFEILRDIFPEVMQFTAM